MRFSDALNECMKGRRITRTGWNGKSMYVYYTPGSIVPIDLWKGKDDLTDKEKERGHVHINGHFDMYSAQGSRVIGWLASQTDMSSDDWVVL